MQAKQQHAEEDEEDDYADEEEDEEEEELNDEAATRMMMMMDEQEKLYLHQQMLEREYLKPQSINRKCTRKGQTTTCYQWKGTYN